MECGQETGKFLFLANHSGELCANHPHVSTIIAQIYLFTWNLYLSGMDLRETYYYILLVSLKFTGYVIIRINFDRLYYLF